MEEVTMTVARLLVMRQYAYMISILELAELLVTLSGFIENGPKMRKHPVKIPCRSEICQNALS